MLEHRRPIRRPALAGVLLLATAVAAAAFTSAPATARTGDMQSSRTQARALATEISALDVRIGEAVTRYSRATKALEAVRRQLSDNRRLQRLAFRELSVARATLTARAVAMYKHNGVGPMDAVFGAADLSDLVTQLTMLRTIARCDRDIVRSVESTRRELADRAQALEADERTAARLVGACKTELGTIRARLEERRTTLAGVRTRIRRLAARAQKSSPGPSPTVEPPDQGGGGDGEGDDGGGGGDSGGSGPWWPLIRSAAASNGVSARGMYRLMMIESGGSATIVGPGGFYGLFQYAPATWKGSWNPWRSSSITDGTAQIKATAHAIRLGYGHAWWDPSYSWAFQGG